MKLIKIFVCLWILFTGISAIYAEKAVILETTGFNSLRAPETNQMRLDRVNQQSEYSSLRKYDNVEYFSVDEEVFDSKAGQVFSKFVNDKVINNKLNSYTSNLGEK